ncbi:MAG: 2'-5' RNA ligase family protein [Aureispira sp.]|nr:2'-5' RNA ligase family protein [Aureispira sp.]
MKANHQLYFIGIIPPEPIFGEIESLKQELFEQYQTKVALKSPAHITIYRPFQLNKEQELSLDSALSNFFGNSQPFDITLTGYGCFEPRVLFVQPSSPPELIALHEKLIQELKKSFALDSYQNENRAFHPHITIANRDIQPVFYKAWKEIEEQSYDRNFEANSATLLRHNGKNWDRIGEYSFQK